MRRCGPRPRGRGWSRGKLAQPCTVRRSRTDESYTNPISRPAAVSRHRYIEIRPGVRSGHGPPSHFPAPATRGPESATLSSYASIACSRTPPASLLDDVERRGGVDEGVDVGRPDCVDEVREGRIAVHVRAQGHGAHEHSDQLVEQRIVAPGLGSPQQGVRRAGDRRQQHRDRRMQHPEGRRVDAPGHGTERRPHLTVEAGRDPPSARPRLPTGIDIQRHTGERLGPLRARPPRTRESLSRIPSSSSSCCQARVVRVIPGRGAHAGVAPARRACRRGEIGDQRRERESVESDVSATTTSS